MRDDELRQLLRERNPWWRLAAIGRDATEWVCADPTLLGAEAVGIEYEPDVLADVGAPGLWVLRGPRRIGKSVTAKRLIARLCQEPEVDPRKVIYFSADGFRGQDLRRAFVLARDLTAAGDRAAVRFWVVDEITAVAEWVPVVKELRDNTPLATDAVVLTGSSAADLDEARRGLGAGRTGVATPFRLLLPMTFREFVTTTAVEIPLHEPVAVDKLQSKASQTTASELEPFVDVLDLAWQRFLECGGFPRAVGEHHHTGSVSAEFAFDLVSWLTGDVDPDGPAESIPRMLAELNRRSTSPLDLRNTANALGMTRDRLRVRLARLISTFAAFWCARADDRGRQVEGAQSKLYLLDPLIAQLPTLRDGAFPAPSMAKLTEAQIAIELARAIDRLHPERFVEQRAVMYARTARGKEIDFSPVPIHRGGIEAETVPIEGKWVTNSWRSEALSMRARYGRGIIATKNITDTTDDIWALPAPVLALLLQ